jgi:D-alanyl-D-alanine carboxypeptidase
VTPAAAPARPSAVAATSAALPVPSPAVATAPAAAPAAAPALPQADAATTVVVASTQPAVITPLSKNDAPRSDVAGSVITKSEAVQSEPARSEAPRAEAAKPEAAKPEPARLEVAKADIVKPEPSAAQIRARGGWVIQIGAFEAEEEARQHLSEARLKIPRILAGADPFTERVQKGEKALYRARFAGFDKAMAEAACKQLKRSDIACMTVKN